VIAATVARILTETGREIEIEIGTRIETRIESGSGSGTRSELDRRNWTGSTSNG
jgi:hypothetical protein